ncbi:MAG: triose-phosphate isomerase [Clostridia bacterium]|nr:triose-phosphate isomerase [Clostridia bacterium]
MRKPIIAGNWKMHKSIKEAVEFIEAIKADVKDTDVEVVLCAPATMLKDMKAACAGTNIKVGAQNMHYEESGAFTGEIAPAMLKEIDVDYVIIGHSERRQYFNETDETVNKKVLKAIETGIRPIMCCGETLEEREAGNMESVVKGQIVKGFANIPAEDVAKVVIAYEPIWAIGTGVTASSEQANDAIAFIRTLIEELYDASVSEEVQIQYGGSVKPENVEEIMNQSDIDGALVGGASLKPGSFVELVNF